MATFCRKCGERNEPEARFCESCGLPMPVSIQPTADAAPQTPNADYGDRSQQPRRRWVLYTVGGFTILAIGIVAAAFLAPMGPLAGLASALRGFGAGGADGPLYYVGRNGKWGYINKAGSEVISLQYDAPPPLRPGYPAYPLVIRSAAPYPVFKSGKWSVVNGRGVPVGQRVLDEIRSSPQSSTVCGRVGMDWGCVDAAGRDAIPFKYEAVGMSMEGLTAVKSNGRWGYVDQAGVVVVQPLFLDAGEFNQGLAAVQFDDKAWGLIDRSGKEVSKKRYARAHTPGDGVWPVKDGDSWVIANLSGDITYRLADVLYIGAFQEGLAMTTWKSRRLPNLIDITGKVVATLPYLSYANQFNDGLAAIQAGHLTAKGFIRKDGRYVVPPLFDAVSNFVEGAAVVQKGTEVWTIDLTGRAIWPKEKRAIPAPTNDLDSLKRSRWRLQKTIGDFKSFIGATVDFRSDTIHIETVQKYVEIPYRSREIGILQLTIEGEPEAWEFLAYGDELVIFERKERYPMLLTRIESLGKEREKSLGAESTAQGKSLFTGLPSLFGGAAGGSPSDVIKTFYVACNDAKYSEADRLLTTATRELMNGELGAMLGGLKGYCDSQTKIGSLQKTELLKEDIRGEGAELRIKLYYKDGSSADVTMSLTKVEGTWKLSPR